MKLEGRYRLVTRSDFDGLACAAMLDAAGVLDSVEFAHPADMQAGKVPVGPRDITTNLPYVEGVGIAFDHHLSETFRVGERPNFVSDPLADSAARVLHNWLLDRGYDPGMPEEVMEAVDQADSARYTEDDILNPSGWTLLNFLMDPRTGLGRFRDFTISNRALMSLLARLCRELPVDEILKHPDVCERVELYFKHEPLARRQIQEVAAVHRRVLVLDYRGEETVYAANRFLCYAMYPRCEVSVHVMRAKDPGTVALALGKSIVNRTSDANLGLICLGRGGGGHAGAGTFQVPEQHADRDLRWVVTALD
jgi:nanoRNase/pAp phosphatase (c-di-AMP/oligoRNAs hydrolase)